MKFKTLTILLLVALNVFANKLDLHAYIGLSEGSKNDGLSYYTPNIGIGSKYTYCQYLLKPFAATNIGYFDGSYIYDVSIGSYIGSKYQLGLGAIMENYINWKWQGPSLPYEKDRVPDFSVVLNLKTIISNKIPISINIYPSSGPSYKVSFGYILF